MYRAKGETPDHDSPREQWVRHQNCVAICGGDSLPSSCQAGYAELQFPEPSPGMSGLFASWLWCGARPTGDGVAQLGDEPDDNACASHQLMIRTNIVDQVQLPATLEPGAYMLSWRWVRVHLCLSLHGRLGAEGACCAAQDCEQTNQIWQNCADVEVTA